MEEKLWTKKYILSVVILFGICMCSNIVLSVLTIFAKNLTGLDMYAGLMTSIFTLAALSVRFVAGWLIDHFNCKKVMLVGALFMLLASILFINCQAIALACVCRALQGIGFGIASTGASTYVTKACHPTKLLEGVSYASIANSLTGVIGPSIAFMIIGTNYDRFPLLFIVSLVIVIATLVLIVLSKDVSMAPIPSQQKEVVKENIHWNLLLLPVLILFINSLTQSAITSFVSLYAISLGFVGAGSFFSVNAVGMITSRLVMNRFVKRFGDFTMILINSAIFFISILLLSRVTAMWQMLLLAFPAGFSMGSIAPIVNTFLILKMPESKNGLANALYYSSMDIGYAIGSIVWGVVATMFGYANIFLIGACLQIICVMLSRLQTKLYKCK